MGNGKQIVLTLFRNEQNEHDIVLTTPTATYRDRNTQLSSFLESAINLSDGGNTIMTTKDYIQLKDSNLKMESLLRKACSEFYRIDNDMATEIKKFLMENIDNK